jgi:hypothetical protein
MMRAASGLVLALAWESVLESASASASVLESQ